mgnify:CR=1 FL=1
MADKTDAVAGSRLTWPDGALVKPLPKALLALARNHALLLVFALLMMVGGATSEYFLTVGNINDLLRSMAVPGLLALGVTFVLLVGRIDLSMGAAMIFCPIMGITVMGGLGDLIGFDAVTPTNSYKGGAIGMILIALAAGTVIGLANAVGVLYARVAAFITTLAMMQALRGLNYVVTDGQPYYIQSPSYTWMGELDVFGLLPFSFIVYAACLLAAIWGLRRTTIGRRLYAVGGNEAAARLAGINTHVWIAFAFALNGVLSALAGILFTSRLQSVDAPMASGFELTAIAFAVVGGVSLRGGRGRPYNAFIGTLVISTLLQLFNIWGLQTSYQTLATGVIIIVVVIFDRFVTRQRV